MRQKLWINTTGLNTLGLAMPETTDDLEAVLLAFKEQDPNGNGLADEIPLTGATGTWSADVYDYPMNPFIYNDGASYLYMNHNKEVDFNANKPEWRDVTCQPPLPHRAGPECRAVPGAAAADGYSPASR